MFIEPLEDRVAPAAVIALTLTGTSLKISPSSTTPITTFVDSNGVFDVIGVPGDSFTLNGSPLQSAIVNGSPAAALTGHHIGAVSIVDSNVTDTGDIVTIASPISGSLSINLAGASSSLFIETPKIQGAFSVKTSGGTNLSITNGTGSMNTIFGGPVKLDLGIGANQTVISANQLEIDGGLTYTGGATKAGQSPTGSNLFAVSGTTSLEIVGGLSFSSKFAPSTFSIISQSVEIGGNLSVVTTGTFSGNLPDQILASSVTIGGNLSLTANTSLPQMITASSGLNVDGKVTLVQTGSGPISLTSSGAISIGALAATGHGGTFTLQGFIGTAASSGLVSNGATMIAGGLKIANFIGATVTAVGEVGGSVSVTGVEILTVDHDLASFDGHLAIGGSFSASAPPSPTTGTAAVNSVEISDVVVGGSLTISSNNGGGVYDLTDTGIFGATTLNVGTKVGATGVSVTVTEMGGEHQMFFANGFTANLPGSGSLSFIDDNPTPDVLVFGQATFSEPAGSKLTATLPSALFALPVKFTTSK